jgi:hypothetical protein
MTRKMHWLIFALVLGLAVGLFVGCDDDDDDDDSNELSVELSWPDAVNVDLIVTEPTGENVGPNYSANGPSTTSLGDNLCGFGDACDTTQCTGTLACNAREGVYADTIVPGTYTIRVNNLAEIAQTARILLTIPQSWAAEGQAYFLQLDCDVPAGAFPIIASAEFASRGNGVISGEIAEVTCTVTNAGYR